MATPSNMLALGTAMPAVQLVDAATAEKMDVGKLAQGKRGTLAMFICNHCPFVVHIRQEPPRGSPLALRGRRFGVNCTSVGSDVDDLLARYARLEDAEILKLALAPGNLTDDGRTAVATEMERRALVPALVPALRVDVQEWQLAELVGRIRARPCPFCGGTETPLNGAILGVQTPGFDPHAEPYPFIACWNCLRNEGHPELFHRQRWPARPELVDFVRSRAGILVHFGGRDDLIDAVLRQDFDELVSLLQGHPPRPTRRRR